MPISWPHFKLSAPISKTILKLQFLTSRSKLFSLLASSIPPQLTSPVPTHQHIAHLILDQKSPSEALRTFKWASKLSNFTHDQSTYRALIHKLCTFRHFDDARKLLEEMPRSIGSPPDENVLITFTRGLGRAHRIKEVIMVPDLILKFDVMPTLKLYNSILDVLVKEDIDIARGFYRKKMMECGVKGDDYTFGILMKGLCLTNRIGDGFKLLQVMKSRGGKQNTVVYNTLLHALCKNGKVGRARSLMNEMIEPNGVTYNLLISAYCKEENLVQAMVMLEKSFDAGFVPDVVTVTKVIELLCNVGRVVEAVEIVERTEANGGKIDVIAYNTLINGFCKIGKARVAVRYLKEMELKGRLPNVDTYNALISGFCETGMVDAALELFNEMKRDGINWNFVTFDTLIAGLCSKGLVDEGFKILELMEDSKGGSGGHISPYNNIIYALYIKNRWEEAFTFLTKMNRMFPRATYRSLMIIGSCEEGSVDTAKKVYQQMIEEGGMPSVLVYSSLIRALCLQNCFKEAFDLMNKMINCKFFPSVSTYNYVVSSFCSQGKVTNSLKLLNDMVGRGCLPDSGTYSPIIDAFCQRGELGKATEVFHQMVDKGIAPTANIWTSLLDHLSREKLWLKSETSSGIHSQIQWIVQP